MVNKILSKLANDKNLAIGVISIGTAVSILSDIAVFAGVYYLALHKGVELRDEYYESEENK